jgi:serine/threonine protein kinase/tetratricopeptide (TPR) repeat protein
MATSSDRNLLYGILALQMDFVSRDALVRGMHAWVLEKTKSLGNILLQQAALAADAHALLEALVQKHLALHGNDPQKSLEAIGSVASARQDLEQITDADVQASMGHIAGAIPSATDPFATRAPVSMGTPTSCGLRYRILRPHAKGGLGEVFIARDEELKREVVLKQIQEQCADDPQRRGRFLLEAEVTGGLEHPGIVPVYGLGTYADGRPFYAMRFIRGDRLEDAIQRFHETERSRRDRGERALAFRRLLGRFVDVCNAIAYAHSRGIIHRDLKPSNVMLGPYGETLVVDWGLAKAIGRGEETGGIGEATLRPSSGSGHAGTIAGQAVGTPAFMSPEQAAGRLNELGPASDIYGLGATLYCLLTGQAPFSGEDLGQLLQKVQQSALVPPRQVRPSVPRALEAVCLKAMALVPRERYASARALADDIEHWLADEPIAAYHEPWTAQSRRWLRRHRILATAGTAALVVAALCLGGATVLLAAANRGEQEARIEAETQRDRAWQAERRALSNADKAEHAAAEAKAVLGFLKDKVLAAARPKGLEGGLGKDATIRAALDNAEPTIARAFAGQPVVEAAVRSTLGDTYRLLAEFRLAQPQLERALSLRRQELDPQHVDVAQTVNSLGLLYWNMGLYAQAEPLYQRSLEIREAKLGKDHPDVATTLTNLASLYLDTGNYAQAEPLMKRSLAIRESQLGRDHPDVAGSLNSLGEVYRVLGQYAQAEQLLKRSLEIRETKLGKTHLDVARSLFSLCHVYNDMGQYAQAEPLLKRCLEIKEGQLGKDHPDVATTLSGLATINESMGRYAQAESLYQRSIRIKETQLGKDHPAVAKSLNDLGDLYRVEGQYAQAERLLKRSLEIWEAKLGKTHPDVATSLINLALVYINMGQYAQAEPLLKRSLEIKEGQLGKNHPDVAASLCGLADLYQAMGRYAQAESLYQRSLQIAEAQLGKDHPDVAYPLTGLAEVAERRGQPAKAEPLFRRSLAIRQAKLVPDHPDTLTSLAEVGDCLLRQGQAAQAEPILRQSWEKLQQKQPDLWSTLEVQALLGAALLAQKQYVQAEPLLVQGYQGMKEREAKIPAPDKHRVAEALGRLVVLYDAWGKKDQANLWRQKQKEATPRAEPRP